MPDTCLGVPDGFRSSSTEVLCFLLQKSDAVRVTTFTGCMGETFLDSKPIGLWNFRDIEGDCRGCAVR